MGRKIGWALAAMVPLVFVLGVSVLQVSATPPNPGHKVTLCHRTGSATGGNTHAGYSIITVDIKSAGQARTAKGHDDHEQVGNGPGGDIIPPYTYTARNGEVFDYPGKNIDAAIGGSIGSEILLNGCKVPVTPSSPPPTTTPPPTTPPTSTPPPATPPTVPPTSPPSSPPGPNRPNPPNPGPPANPPTDTAFTGPRELVAAATGGILLALLGAGAVYLTRRRSA